MNEIFGKLLSTEQDLENLRPILGNPSKIAANKVIHSLDQHCRDFIGKSPFLVIATSDSNGLCDASPRGDSAGFVSLLDEKHFIIPDRPGNRRMDTIRNILVNPHVGIIFLIPGLEETLRINGKACVTQDEQLLQKMAVNGRVPLLGIGVEVIECYVHCGKASKRSDLWNVESRRTKEELPNIPQMLADHVNQPSMTAEEVASQLQDSYKNRMY